jgi:hypothetical protein
MPTTGLDTTDAAELADLLQFLAGWLDTDHDHLDTSLTHYTGSPAYTLTHLRTDLHRFAFLLGATDGEDLFNPEPP